MKTSAVEELAVHSGDTLVVDLDGYEGPLDVLLALARDQKVDLSRISILQLADQYLAFVARVRRRQLELAADYLVMAAWLAYLKSRLLLPEAPAEDEPTPIEMAEALTFQLRRLESMQESGAKLMARPHLGRDFFARGAPEGVETNDRAVLDVTLYDLLKAYADFKRRDSFSIMEIEPTELYSMERALARLEEMVGRLPGWDVLWKCLPAELKDDLLRRSAISAVFLASLELTRQGKIELRQDGHFAPIYTRRTKS
jgi:segregation and condensation protein A